MTLRGEPTWGGVAAPASAAAGTSPAAQPARFAPDAGMRASTPTEDLEADVYTERDVHGDERAALRRALAQARSSLTEQTYRRALELARDSVLLSIDECVHGALAMEWEPQPRPEFSLATIEAAVAEQERAEQRRRAG